MLYKDTAVILKRHKYRLQKKTCHYETLHNYYTYQVQSIVQPRECN